MTKSVIKCSKCETRYHYFGDIPNGEFVCELCVFSFKKISVNPNSKKSRMSFICLNSVNQLR